MSEQDILGMAAAWLMLGLTVGLMVWDHRGNKRDKRAAQEEEQEP